MPRLSNADIAKVLLGLAQLLAVQKENRFKIQAYRRAAKAIVNLSGSVDEMVRTGTDLTSIPGIGTSIADAIREIVQRGGALQQLEDLRAKADRHSANLSDYPLLDPKQVERVYKKLGISSLAELRERLESGEIGQQMGNRMEHHIRQGLAPTTDILIYHAHEIVPGVAQFLQAKCAAARVEPAGDFRRRVEVLGELSFLIQADHFGKALEAFQRYGGGTRLVNADETAAVLELPSGVRVRLPNTSPKLWGLSLLIATGSELHVSRLLELGYDLTALMNDPAGCPTEETVYRKLGLQPIAPELREGNDEIARAAAGRLPVLVTEADICGDLHAHTVASDGAQTIEQMAAAAGDKGYRYLGIADHSPSLAIARGVSEADLWTQLRRIDEINARAEGGVRILKSAEVDILADGRLDYSDAVLKELDYTVCSIHSRFSLDRKTQTERLMRAMDNRYCNIVGHPTGRRLLRRHGYDLDFERVVEHARQNGCFFEINSSPERLDLSAKKARQALEAGVKIAINTDAHSTRELNFIAGGVEQARRAGLEKESILNCMPWNRLHRLLQR
jgi:DNA polymerase (family 10)